MRTLFTALFVIITAPVALAHQTVKASDAYVVDTIPGMANAAAYLRLTNGGESVSTLTGVSLSGASQGLAAGVQIHTHVMDGDLMRMQQIPEPLKIGINEQLVMAPGGIHIMLLGLTKTLDAGTTLEVTLHLQGEHTRDLRVQIPVLSADDVPLSMVTEMDEGHGDQDGHDGNDGH